MINNADYALLGAVEEAAEAEVRAEFETKFFGALAVIQTVLPLLRQQGGGHIRAYPASRGFSAGLAWISTDRNWPNIGACRPVLDEAERIAVPPGDGDRFVEDAGGEDDGEVGATMEAHPDFTLRDGDVGGHIDEVAEDEARLGVVVAAHAAGHETIEA